MEPTSLMSFSLAGRFFTASATWEAPYRNPLGGKAAPVGTIPAIFVASEPALGHVPGLCLTVSEDIPPQTQNWTCILRTKGLLVDSSFFRYQQIG